MEIYGGGEMFNFSLECGIRKIFVEEVIPKEWIFFFRRGKRGFLGQSSIE